MIQTFFGQKCCGPATTQLDSSDLSVSSAVENNGGSCCSLSSSKCFEDAIREKAYLLWEEAGRPEGDGVEFWIEAEKQLTN